MHTILCLPRACQLSKATVGNDQQTKFQGKPDKITRNAACFTIQTRVQHTINTKPIPQKKKSFLSIFEITAEKKLYYLNSSTHTLQLIGLVLFFNEGNQSSISL